MAKRVPPRIHYKIPWPEGEEVEGKYLGLCRSTLWDWPAERVSRDYDVVNCEKCKEWLDKFNSGWGGDLKLHHNYDRRLKNKWDYVWNLYQEGLKRWGRP